MGCDIHIILEQKWNDRWVGLREITEAAAERNYKLFSRLCDCGRGDGPKPRGFPEDVSDLSLLEEESWDGHSKSWLSLIEATPIFIDEGCSYKTSSPDTDSYYYLWGILDYEENELENYRIVFWFDN